MPKPVQNPEKELRFTRAGQSMIFWVLAAVLVGGAVTLVASGYYRHINPALPHPLWAMIPLTLGWLVARMAMHMTRHAYLILTPLGVEIFPLIRAEKNMRVIYWQEIAGMDLEGSRLTLHFDAEKSGGVHLTLRPIPKLKRDLLVHALRERIEGKK